MTSYWHSTWCQKQSQSEPIISVTALRLRLLRRSFRMTSSWLLTRWCPFDLCPLNLTIFNRSWDITPSLNMPGTIWKRGGVWMCKLRMIFQEWLKIEVKLLASCNIRHVDWHNNGWPWVTLNGRFTLKSTSSHSHRALSLR